MQRNFVGLGLIVLFAGLITFSTSYQSTLDYESERTVRLTDLPYGEWIGSMDFKKGEMFYLGFQGPNLENVPNGDQVSGWLEFNITDPLEGNTTFLVTFKGSEAPEINVTLKLKSDGLEVNDSDFGDFNDSPEDIGGKTLYEGNYSIQAYTFSKNLAKNFYYPPDGSLGFLEIWRRIPNRTYSNEYLRIYSIILIGAGLAITVWGIKPQRTHRIRRK